MLMKGMLRACFVHLVFVSTSGLLFAEGAVEVIVQVNSSSTALVRGAEVEPMSVRMTSLRLEKGWLVVDDENGLVAFDRAGDRVLKLHPGVKEYESTSLFAVFEYRLEAYRRLLSLEDFGYAESVRGTGLPRVLADHMIGICDPEEPSVPESTESGGKRRWSTGDQALASWSTKGTRLTADQMEMLVYWMRQTTGGHPMILSDLVGGGMVPDSMDFLLNDGRTVKTVTIDLVGVREIPDIDVPGQIGGWTRVTAGDGKDAFLVLLDWVLNRGEFTASVAAAGNEDYSKAEKAFQNGDPIRGILETLRVEMVLGTSPAEELDRHLAQIRESRTATNIFASLGASSPPEHLQAVQTLDVLKDAFEDQVAVLNVLSAQNLARMGQLGLAESSFREAIMKDPSLAVAYQQLGDIFRATNRNSLGWLCYEAFGLISPDHPANQQIRELREALQTRFADFF
ncbi:MAG: hypothetical protein R3F07_10240 [Opitutaceae bacterium]